MHNVGQRQKGKIRWTQPHSHTHTHTPDACSKFRTCIDGDLLGWEQCACVLRMVQTVRWSYNTQSERMVFTSSWLVKMANQTEAFQSERERRKELLTSIRTWPFRLISKKQQHSCKHLVAIFWILEMLFNLHRQTFLKIIYGFPQLGQRSTERGY